MARRQIKRDGWVDKRRFDPAVWRNATPQALRKAPRWRDRYV